jgi:glucose-6-phosphate 1-dehydrogenase
VAADSTVETFAALEVLIDNDRWHGVPFQLRTGKAPAQSRHTVTLGFRQPADRLFAVSEGTRAAAQSNEVSLELSEPGAIWIDFLAKEPGTTMDLGPASLTFRYRDSFEIANELEGTSACSTARCSETRRCSQAHRESSGCGRCRARC